MDGTFFDPIFDAGAVTEQRIESAGARIKELIDQNQYNEAEAAINLLAKLLLMAIADGRVPNPPLCAGHYFRATAAAQGLPTLLDAVKSEADRRSRAAGN